MNTHDLIGPALDWAVAKCEGKNVDPWHSALSRWLKDHKYSSDWSQGGPIIEREGIAIDCVRCDGLIDSWVAACVYQEQNFDGLARAEEYGPTPLIAAMRCFVASKMGDTVDIPEELK